jgi:hypothetical protein
MAIGAGSKTHIDCCFQVIDIDVEFGGAGLGDLVDLGHHTLIREDVAGSGKGLHLVGGDPCRGHLELPAERFGVELGRCEVKSALVTT